MLILCERPRVRSFRTNLNESISGEGVEEEGQRDERSGEGRRRGGKRGEENIQRGESVARVNTPCSVVELSPS